MWKSIAGLCLMAGALATGPADAAFVIRLKNGNEFVTSRHWQEGKQVMFDVYDGVFGVDKALVTTIEQSDKPVRVAVKGQKNTENGSQVEVTNQKRETIKSAAPAEARTEAKRDADDPILKDFNRLKEKSAHLDKMLTSEIRELLKEITGFKNMISRNSKYFVDYAREFNEAQEIGNITETALRSRDQ
jgi:flagellar motility protein MotE (MotC chaperone)